MVSKIEVNKLEKEQSLAQAAYELFMEKGIHETSINSIVKRAGVGKGTFYLYFENKYDILEKIILDKTKTILSEAINFTKANTYETFEEEVVSFIDYIIEYLKENKLLLKLMHKNLSWGIYRKAYRDYEEIHEIYSMFERGYKVNDADITIDEVKKRLFMILELTGSVCYSSIVLGEPTDIDEMKETLFNAIIKII